MAGRKKSTTANMQNVSFRSVEEFLAFLPPDELSLVSTLRSLVVECIPGITEKLSYNVPFYHRHNRLFFIWPASVLWGKKQTWSGVRFGFQQGHLLADELNYLDRGERKYVYWKAFKQITVNDISILKNYIFEAELIDSGFKNKKSQPG
jgi:hypothetical protein